MHAVYYKKLLNIVLWAYLVTTVQTPMITAYYVENDRSFYCAKWQQFFQQSY